MSNIRSIFTDHKGGPTSPPVPAKAGSTRTLAAAVNGVSKEVIGSANKAKALTGRVSLRASGIAVSGSVVLRGIRKIS